MCVEGSSRRFVVVVVVVVCRIAAWENLPVHTHTHTHTHHTTYLATGKEAVRRDGEREREALLQDVRPLAPVPLVGGAVVEEREEGRLPVADAFLHLWSRVCVNVYV